MPTTSRANSELVPAASARQMLLHAQGLLNDPARKVTHAAVAKLIGRMGYVQVDSINVVERAHHLTLASRLDGYRHDHLSHLHEKRRALFEHWTHDASLIPVEFFAHWHHRRRRFVERKSDRLIEWMKLRIGSDPQKVLDAVLSRIEREGPLQSRDFEHPPGRSGSWWGWKPSKAALEYLWWKGELSVARRVNFQKVYDLTSRTYPEHHALEPPDEGEFVDWCCRAAVERSGAVTAKEITDFFGVITLAEARAWMKRAAKNGEVTEVLIESADGANARPGVAPPDWKRRARRAQNALSKLDGRMRLLSPFDPVLRNRDRTRRYFNFEYTFEAFVPAPKRRYGYYVLPIMQGDALIGRTDVKFHRDQSTLVFNGVWWESQVKQTRAMKAGLNEAADRLARFVGAERFAVKKQRVRP